MDEDGRFMMWREDMGTPPTGLARMNPRVPQRDDWRQWGMRLSAAVSAVQKLGKFLFLYNTSDL